VRKESAARKGTVPAAPAGPLHGGWPEEVLLRRLLLCALRLPVRELPTTS